MGKRMVHGPNEKRPIIIWRRPVCLPQVEKSATGSVVKRSARGRVRQHGARRERGRESEERRVY